MKPSPARYIQASNLLTYTSVGLACWAIVAASKRDSHLAGALIAAAAIADTYDGRFARLFKRADDERRFGGQIDTLADAISFGLAPMAVVYFTRDAAAFLSVAAFAYIIAAITRLAYFNLNQTDSDDFVGLPVPAAALFISTALAGSLSPVIVSAISAIAMVAPIRVPRPKGIGLVIFTLWPCSLVAIHLWS